MTTLMEHTSGELFGYSTMLTRAPAHKISASLLSLAQSALDGVIVIDSMRQIVLVNQRAEEMFGYSAGELLERPLDILMPPRLANEQRRRMERLATTRRHGRRTKIELKGIKGNGEQLNLQASITRIAVHDEFFLALVLHDLGKPGSRSSCIRPVRPADLRRWAASSQQASEIEKRRFSRELYDDIGQRLSVLKLDLDWLEHSLPQVSHTVPARVAQMQGLLDNVIAMTKNMASALRPPLLDDFGLAAAVEWMAEAFQKRTGIRCVVETSGTMELDEAVESAIFRVVQESLANIERHAHAENVRIALIHTANQLDVMIRDDGIGMHGNEHKAGCFGLIAMQERIFVLGGTISIESAAPSGVVICASIPIDPTLSTDPSSIPPTTCL